MTSKTHFDIVVVGAGPHGLCVAHTFLKLDPSLEVLIVDRRATVGGNWAEEMLYPNLRTNNLQGYFEFSDFPLLDAGLGCQPRQYIPGETAHRYFHKYADHFDLLRRTRLSTSVKRATNHESDSIKAWTLELVSTDGQKSPTPITCSKLIVASGAASQPLVPAISGLETFNKPIFHNQDLAQKGKAICADPSIKHVTVLGGGKSAHDAVYMFATAGKKVTWLTRRSGRGWVPMAKSYVGVGPFKLWLEGLIMSRPISWFSMCAWPDAEGFGWIRYFLHNTAVGQALVRTFFAKMTFETYAQSGVLDDDSTKVLMPKDSLMWWGSALGILHYDTDFYELIRSGQVEPVQDEVVRVDGQTSSIALANGKTFETDAFVYALGYKYDPSFSIEPHAKKLDWGIPVPAAEDKKYPAVDAKADAELFEKLPMLQSSPKSLERQPELTPWRLWRFLAPPSQVLSGKSRNLIFFNAVDTFELGIKTEITSLWAYAYLNNALSCELPKTEEDVAYEATLWSRFGRWRSALGFKGSSADLFLESLPYYDLLLRDLGLRSWRKGWGFLGEVFGGWYTIQDYKGLAEEWMRARGDASRKILDKKTE